MTKGDLYVGNGGPRSVRWMAPVVIVAATFTALAAGPASPAAAATVVEVEAGYAGTYIPGNPLPVRVRLAADRLISGALQVVVDGVTTSVPVEVPGGSKKDFVVITPTMANRSSPVTVIARLPDGSKSPPSASTSANPQGDQEVVGLSPGALATRPLPGAQPLAVDLGTARFVALTAADLDRAPDSLGALGTIGLGADELGRLAPSTRNGILRWVEAGGHLLVDAVPDRETVAGLPDGWQPGGAARVRAGLGEVRLTSGAMADGKWAGLVEPSPRPAHSPSQFGFGLGLGDSLARDAGFKLPHLSWLVGFLIVYVGLVGPVLFLMLRRRRKPELAWIAIPLVAVVFTGASWAGGRGLRTSTQLVHGTVLSTGATGSTALTYLGLSSRSGGTIRVGWPDGWLTGVGLADGGPVQTSAMTGIELTANGPVGRVPLDANQFGLVAATGPSGATGGLEVTAASSGTGQAGGTVRNTTRFTIDGAAVFMGTSAQSIGPLRPGESRTWHLVSPPAGGSGPPVELTVFGEPSGLQDTLRSTTLGLWSVAQTAGYAPRELGTAVAVGWTSGYEPPVRIGGRSTHAKGTTLVVGTAGVTGADRPVKDVAVRREALNANARGTASAFRFTLPAGAGGIDPAKLVLRTTTVPIEVWTGSEWTSISSNVNLNGPIATLPGGITAATTVPGGILAPCPPGAKCVGAGVPLFQGPTEVPLPAGALRDGAVFVRYANGVAITAFADTSFSLRELP